MSWIQRLKSAFGQGEGTNGSTTVPVQDVRYSMPTVAADVLTFVEPTPATYQGAPRFHEDEWCQIEFLPGSGLQQLKGRLGQYKVFEQAHRLEHGWSRIHARQWPREVVIEGDDATSKLAALFAVELLHAPILATSSVALGQVQDGFALRPSSDVLLYGLADARGITALGATVAGDDTQLSRVFSVLYGAYGLLLVDWRGQLVLCEVDAGGQFAAWRP
ncbi:MAG: hypothetical protein ABWZ85_09870 [Luteibacter sp.]